MNNLVLQILFDTINRSGSGVISKNELRLFYTAFLDVGKLGEKKIRKISDLLCYFVLFYFFLLQLITGSKKKFKKFKVCLFMKLQTVKICQVYLAFREDLFQVNAIMPFLYLIQLLKGLLRKNERGYGLKPRSLELSSNTDGDTG